MAFSLGLSSELNELFYSLVSDPKVRRIFLLTVAGLQGPHSWELHRAFSELGVLHLLVLSGSQVSSLFVMVRALLRVMGVAGGAGPRWDHGVTLLSLLFCAYYVTWCGLSPPLTRALLWISSECLFPALSLGVRLISVFLLQCLAFDQSLGDPSLLLSWVAFLGMHFFSKLRLSTLWKIVGTSMVAQGAVVFIFQQNPGAFNWPTILAANLYLIFVFDKGVMPLASVAYIAAFLINCVQEMGFSVGSWIPGLGGILAPFYKTAGGLVLVALEELR